MELSVRAGAVGICAMKRWQKAKAAEDMLFPSPYSPAMPQLTLDATRKNAAGIGKSAGNPSHAPAKAGLQPEVGINAHGAAANGQAGAIPYAHYRRSRLASLRSDLGLGRYPYTATHSATYGLSRYIHFHLLVYQLSISNLNPVACASVQSQALNGSCTYYLSMSNAQSFCMRSCRLSLCVL